MVKWSHADSVIQEIIDDTMAHAKGLDYAAYAIVGGSAAHRQAGDSARQITISNQARSGSLKGRLTNLALSDRSEDEQVALWRQILQSVHANLEELNTKLISAGQGSCARAVLDVHMGGFFYSRLDRQSVLFGATIDQTQVNSGRCEREMYHMVAQIEAVFLAHGA